MISADPSEEIDLASDPEYQTDILVMKGRVLELLSDLVDPGEHVHECRLQSLLDMSSDGGYTPGWCQDINLKL